MPETLPAERLTPPESVGGPPPPGAGLKEAIQLHRTGQLARAETVYRRLLAREPRNADALHLLGVVAIQVGRADAALSMIDRAIEVDPRAPDFYNNRGRALQALGRQEEALASFNRALRLRPAFIEAQTNRANALRALGRDDEAIAGFEAVLKLDPKHAASHKGLGNLLRKKGEADRAVSHLGQAVLLRPNDADAHFKLGLALVAKERLLEAVRHLEKCVAAKPDDPALLRALAFTLHMVNRNVAAEPVFRRVLELQPADVDTRIGLSRVLAAGQRVDEARALLNEALALAPDSREVRTAFIFLCDHLGLKDEVTEHWRQILAKWPNDASALRELALVEAGALPPELREPIEKIASDGSKSSGQRRSANRILAAHYAGQRDFENAGKHYFAMNEFRKEEYNSQSVRFDLATQRIFTDRQIRTCTEALLRQKSVFGSESDLPIFVVGMPRSGTTLCEQVLASHSQIMGAGELVHIHDIVALLPSQVQKNTAGLREPYPECLKSLSREVVQEVAGGYIDKLRQFSTTALRIVDKMPGNALHLGLIAILFPRARIIHCRRSPMDTCFSCYTQDFSAPIPWAVDLTDLGQYYREQDRLVRHWRAVVPSPMLELVYEDFVEDFEPTARRLIEFCGLEWEEGCLDFTQTKRVVRTASVHQVRRPVYKSSVGKWRNYATLLAPLREALGDLAD